MSEYGLSFKIDPDMLAGLMGPEPDADAFRAEAENSFRWLLFALLYTIRSRNLSVSAPIIVTAAFNAEKPQPE